MRLNGANPKRNGSGPRRDGASPQSNGASPPGHRPPDNGHSQHPGNGDAQSAAAHAQNDAYDHAKSEYEAFKSAYAKDLDERQKVARAHPAVAALDACKAKYGVDSERLQSQRDEARRDSTAADEAAAALCGDNGVIYVPGKTTGADILDGPPLSDEEAARRSGLPFGVSLPVTLFMTALKFVLGILCCFASGVSLGLAFRLLSVKNGNLIGTPAMDAVCVVMGALVAIGIYVAVTSWWKPVGGKVGFLRPAREVWRALILVAVLTLVLTLGLGNLDSHALIVLNAARAALNPAFAIAPSAALLIGLLLSAIYVFGTAATAFAEGYNHAARQTIAATVAAAAVSHREAVLKTGEAQEALAQLGRAEACKKTLSDLDTSLKALDTQFRQDEAALLAKLPTIPDSLTPKQQRHLVKLRARLRAERVRRDAYWMSRRGSAADSTREARSGDEHGHGNH